VYIRDCFSREDTLLVNQIINGQTFPAKLILDSGFLTPLVEHPASCATLAQDDTLFYVKDDTQLIRHLANGGKQTVHSLSSRRYDDLFTSRDFLYASVQGADGFYIQRFDLKNFDITTHTLEDNTMLAVITSSDEAWQYVDIKK